MNKLRVKFTKINLMKFISHLDLLRLMDRAIRRAEIKLVFSQGFNPHPKISFATAVPIGLSSDGEYMDVELEERIEPASFMDKVNDQLPSGIEIITAKYIDPKAPALMAIVDASTYIVKCSLREVTSKDSIEKAIKSFMEQEKITIHKASKKSRKNESKEVNIKDHIYQIEILEHDPTYTILKMTLATGSKGNLKPETLIEKLILDTGLSIQTSQIKVHRLELYTLSGDMLVTPLEINA